MSKDINVTDGTVLETLNNKVDLDGGNYPGSGLEEYINTYHHSQITNCITEIPQRIKLELADGVLTLKAGSEVIVPNGFEADGTTPKFDYVTVESDWVKADISNANSIDMVWLPFGVDNVIYSMPPLVCLSGNTQPANTENWQYILWYDTQNNDVKFTRDYGSTWYGGQCLPLGLVNSDSTKYTSINQTFNGMGYIGSTIWVDKGVKCLMPNGRNEDGSLKNLEVTTSRLSMRTYPSNLNTSTEYMYAIDSILGMGESLLIELDYIPTSFITNTVWILHTPTNIVYQWNGTAYVPKDLPLCVIANKFTATNGKITSFEPKQPFRAIDYSDKSEVSGWAMPSNKYITLTPGASGTRYTAPANGWVRCWGYKNTADVGYVQLFAYGGIGVHSYVPKGWGCGSLSVPVRKGQQFGVEYYNDISEARLEFRYAQGEI